MSGPSGRGIRFLSEYDTEGEENSSVSLGKYKNLMILKADENLSKEAALKQREDQLIGAVIEDSVIKADEYKIKSVALKMAEEFANRLNQQGLSVEQYYEITGLDAVGLVGQMMPTAEKRVKGRLVLLAIARAEGLEARQEEYDNEISRLSSMYLMGAEEIKSLIAGKEEKQIREDIAIHKALEFLMGSAVDHGV